jgi:Glycosyl transferases group 1
MRLGLLTEGRLARPLFDGFVANGCEVERLSKSEQLDFRGFDYLLLYGPMAPIGRLIKGLKSLKSIPPVLFWYTEQMPNPSYPTWLVRMVARIRYQFQGWYDEKLFAWIPSMTNGRLSLPAVGRIRGIGEMLAIQELGCLELICAFTNTNKAILNRQGLPAVEVPVGYHPFFGEPLSQERDIDFVFLGTTRDSRRKRLIKRLERELIDRNIHYVIKDGSPQRGFIFDRDRTILLNRTNIMLNIMRQPWDDPLYRFLLAAANGALLLSEPVWQESRGPLRPGVHYVECNLHEMGEYVVELLKDESKRRLITDNAFELIKDELTMEKSVAQCLDIIQ